jgi:hypothetical protein
MSAAGVFLEEDPGRADRPAQQLLRAVLVEDRHPGQLNPFARSVALDRHRAAVLDRHHPDHACVRTHGERHRENESDSFHLRFVMREERARRAPEGCGAGRIARMCLHNRGDGVNHDGPPQPQLACAKRLGLRRLAAALQRSDFGLGSRRGASRRKMQISFRRTKNPLSGVRRSGRPVGLVSSSRLNL